MIPIRRYLGTLRAAFQLATGGGLPPAPAGALLWALLRLEWRATVERCRPGSTVRFRVLGYDVEAFSCATLLMLFRDIFITGVYDLPLPGGAPVIVDAGANIGLATLFFSHRHPGCRILAFEPDPRAFGLLERNVARNGLTGVTLVNAALAGHDGTIPFYYDEARPDLLIMSSNPERLPGSCREVPCRRLSAALPPGRIDLLKLDIEGDEGEVVADLAASGRLGDVDRLALEYHHGIGTAPPRLGGFLRILEESGFVYTLQAGFVPPGRFQDLFIAAVRVTGTTAETVSSP